MNTTRFWLITLAITLATYTIRVSFIALSGRFEMPDWFRRGLRYVPVAALTALVVPSLLAPNGHLELAAGNLRMWAGVLALGVAVRTRNVLATLLTGMVALWALQALQVWLAG